jgi:hypothetical protein
MYRKKVIIDHAYAKLICFQSNPKDSENLLRALDWRVQQLRVQEEKLKESGEVSGKRKAEPESPTEEFAVKKTKYYNAHAIFILFSLLF